MGNLAPDGYHVAIFRNFVMKRDGRIEFHFYLPQYDTNVKYKCEPEDAKRIYKMLTNEEVGSLDRPTLKKAIGRKIVIATEVHEYDTGSFIIPYNKVVDIVPYDPKYEENILPSSEFDPNDWSMENVVGWKS